MQTGWIQACRRVTRRLAWDPTCLLLRVSFLVKIKQILKVLKSRRHLVLFLENYPAFKGLKLYYSLWTLGNLRTHALTKVSVILADSWGLGLKDLTDVRYLVKPWRPAPAVRLVWKTRWHVTVQYSHAHYQIEFISGSGAVPVNWNVIFFSPRFAIFKNVVHSSEPGETPSSSASYQAPNYAHRS